MKRREFLELGSGVAVAALATSPLIAAAGSKTWAPYNETLVIDGLGFAVELEETALKPSLLATLAESGLAAVQQTVPYPGADYARTLEDVGRMLSLIARYPDQLRLVTSVSDIEAARRSGQFGIIMGFQSTEMFSESLAEIDTFAELGVRCMQMTYNGPSPFGGGCLADNGMGLTPLGASALTRMEEQKVLVDLSHANKRTVKEAIEVSTRPLTISHTGCNALYRHPRNNDDAEMKATADRGGVVGVYLMPFLEGGEHEVPAETVVRHLDQMVNVCGEDHVAIGTDQGVDPVDDGPEYREMIRKEVERRIAAGISAPGETPERPPFIPELNTARRMETLAYLMSKRGYGDDRIEKILGLNLLRLYAETWT